MSNEKSETENFTAYIPAGELKLPDAPRNHFWDIRNVIYSTETETHYRCEVRLKNSSNHTMLTVSEEWDTKKEQFSDFAIGVAGLTTVALSAYQQFMSINWGRDNPELISNNPPAHLNDNSTTRAWSTRASISQAIKGFFVAK